MFVVNIFIIIPLLYVLWDHTSKKLCTYLSIWIHESKIYKRDFFLILWNFWHLRISSSLRYVTYQLWFTVKNIQGTYLHESFCIIHIKPKLKKSSNFLTSFLCKKFKYSWKYDNQGHMAPPPPWIGLIDKIVFWCIA